MNFLVVAGDTSIDSTESSLLPLAQALQKPSDLEPIVVVPSQARLVDTLPRPAAGANATRTRPCWTRVPFYRCIGGNRPLTAISASRIRQVW